MWPNESKLAAMSNYQIGAIALVAVAAGFFAGLQTSARYDSLPSGNQAYVIRCDRFTGEVKAVPVDFSVYASR